METATNCWIFINCIWVYQTCPFWGQRPLPSPFPPSSSPSHCAGCLPAGCYWPTPRTGPDQGWVQLNKDWKFSNEPRDNNIVLSRNVLSVLSIAHLATFLPVTSCAHPCLAWRVGGGWPQCELAALCRVYGLPPSLYTWSPSPTSVQQYTSLLGAQVIPSNRSCTHVPGTQWTKQTNIDACFKTNIA